MTEIGLPSLAVADGLAAAAEPKRVDAVLGATVAPPLRDRQHWAIRRALGLKNAPCIAYLDELPRHAWSACEAPVTNASDTSDTYVRALNTVATTMSKQSDSLTFCRRTIADPGQALVVEDLTQEHRVAQHPMPFDKPSLRYCARIPMLDTFGHARRALRVFDHWSSTQKLHQPHTPAMTANEALPRVERQGAPATPKVLRPRGVPPSWPGPDNVQTQPEARGACRVDAQPPLLHLRDIGGLYYLNDASGSMLGYDVRPSPAEFARPCLRPLAHAGRWIGVDFAALMPHAEATATRSCERYLGQHRGMHRQAVRTSRCER